MRYILVGFLCVILFTGTAFGGYSPHWDGPIEVEDGSTTTTNIVVYPEFPDHKERVVIEVRGDASDNIELEQTEFIIDEPTMIEITVNSEGIEPDEVQGGNIEINHRVQSDGEVSINKKYLVSFEVSTVSSGLIGPVHAADLFSGTFLLVGGVLGIVLVLYSVVRYRGVNENDLFEWR